MTTPSWLTELDRFPERMAAEVGALLPSTTLTGYQVFLDTMYHYTRHSEARLKEAAAAATDAELAAFLTALADDEAAHYRLAEADLRAFGLAPSAQPPSSVRRFTAVWSALPSAHAAAWLGALVVLEGVAQHLGAAVLPALSSLGLGKPQARFVLVHLEADADHGAGCRQHARRLGAQHADLLIQGAAAAAAAWVELHQCLAA